MSNLLKAEETVGSLTWVRLLVEIQVEGRAKEGGEGSETKGL